MPSADAPSTRRTTARPPRSARRRRQRAERASSHSPREHGDRRRRLERHARAARRKRQGSLRGRRRGGGGDGAGRRWRRVVRLQRAGACSEPSRSISALSAERTCGTRAETMRPGSHLGALLDRARGDAEPRRRRRNTRRFFCSSTIHPTVRLVRLRDAPCARAIRLTSAFPAPPLRPVLKTRVRSWTAGRGHDFAVPATRDPIPAPFAAGRARIDPALAPGATATPSRAWTRSSAGARRGSAASPRSRPRGVQEGRARCWRRGRRALVRTGCAQARRLRRRRARLRLAEAARAGGGGVLVVTRAAPKPSRAKKNGAAKTSRETRVATLYRAAGATTPGGASARVARGRRVRRRSRRRRRRRKRVARAPIA